MKMFEALEILKDKSVVLVDTQGNKFQRLHDTQIMQIWNRELLAEDDSSTASSIENDDFVEKYLHTEFEIVPQWFDSNVKFPILCKVHEQLWSGYKTVEFKSRSGYWFQTQFGESYLPSYHTEIIPLTDSEINDMKRGY